jgi:2-dehydropantoate 2-reductase
MKILIYGAGVLGSYLAHHLVRGGGDVTMLARGQRVEDLKREGLRIRHYLQRKTTIDTVNVVHELQPDDVYDLIFVVMQYSDFPAVLPALASNQSRHIVLVGNNADARFMEQYLKENSPVEKEVAFAFQTSGGRRENASIIAVHGGGRMEIGGLDGDLSWRPLIEKAFENTRYHLAFNTNIDAWLKSHIVAVLVIFYATYAFKGELSKATQDKLTMKRTIAALDEGFKVLEALNYPITPAGQAQIIRKRPCIFRLFLRIYALTPFPKLIDPLSQIDEMSALDATFDHLRQQANILTPNWDALKGSFQVSA